MVIERGFVVVSGPPGAGKTTLAVPLAQRLGLPLLCKDQIKESLYDHLSPREPSFEWSRAVGGAAMELIWMFAQSFPAAVLEANFRPASTYERQKLAALPAALVEIYCRCPLDLAAERYGRRYQVGERHSAHVLGEVNLDMLREFDRPMALGSVIDVDTTAAVDLDALVGDVCAALSGQNQTT